MARLVRELKRRLNRHFLWDSGRLVRPRRLKCRAKPPLAPATSSAELSAHRPSNASTHGPAIDLLRTRARRDPCIQPDARPTHCTARDGGDGDPPRVRHLDDRAPETPSLYASSARISASPSISSVFARSAEHWSTICCALGGSRMVPISHCA